MIRAAIIVALLGLSACASPGIVATDTPEQVAAKERAAAEANARACTSAVLILEVASADLALLAQSPFVKDMQGELALASFAVKMAESNARIICARIAVPVAAVVPVAEGPVVIAPAVPVK